MPSLRRYTRLGTIILAICVLMPIAACAQSLSDRLRPRQRPLVWYSWDCDPRWVYFKDYKFDFSLVDDTVIPGQAIWLRAAQTNLTRHQIKRLSMVPGGRVYRTRISDSAGTITKIGVEAWFDEPLCDGTLKKGETSVSYHQLKLAPYSGSRDSLRYILAGHSWGVVVQLTVFSNEKVDTANLVRPPLFFTVAKPSGIDAEADSLLQAGQPREVLERFPQSHLVDEAIDRLRVGPSDAARLQMKLNPDSPQLIYWIRQVRYGSGADAYNDILAKLARDLPTARALEALKPEKKRHTKVKPPW